MPRRNKPVIRKNSMYAEPSGWPLYFTGSPERGGRTVFLGTRRSCAQDAETFVDNVRGSTRIA